MTRGSEDNLGFGKKLLAAAGIAAAAGLVLFGLITAPRICAQSSPPDAPPLPSFEVTSVKRNRSGGTDFDRRRAE